MRVRGRPVRLSSLPHVGQDGNWCSTRWSIRSGPAVAFVSGLRTGLLASLGRRCLLKGCAGAGRGVGRGRVGDGRGECEQLQSDHQRIVCGERIGLLLGQSAVAEGLNEIRIEC